MKNNKEHYTEVISERLAPYFDKEKHGSVDNFVNIISESVKKTFEFYEENFDLEDDDFDNEVFESDLIEDAKNAVIQ